jgi:integrase
MAKLLTDTVIRNIRPPISGQVEIADHADVKGLTLRVGKTGTKTFYLVYRSPEDGKQARIKLGTYPALPLADARERARRSRALIENGIDPRTHEKQEDERRERDALKTRLEAERRTQNTFARASEDFIGRCEKARLRRWRERKRHFDVYVPAAWGEHQVDMLTRDDVKALLARIEKKHGPVMANRVVETIRAMFNWLIEEGRVASNPAARVQSEHPERSRDRVLTDAELAAVWHACADLGKPFGPFIRTLILTAQRRNEVATMRVRDVDDGAGIWELPREATKLDRAHRVPLAAVVVEVLDSMRHYNGAGGSAFLFTTTAGARPVAGFSKVKARLDGLIASAAKKVEGVPVAPWTLHDLRRTAASGMARLGVPLHVIELILNHQPREISGVAAIYNRHGFDREKREALEAWANHVAAITDKSSKVVRLTRSA